MFSLLSLTRVNNSLGKFSLLFGKNHTRMPYHFVCTLGLLSSFWAHDQNKEIDSLVTALCGIKRPKIKPDHDRSMIHHTNTMTSFTMCNIFLIQVMAHIFNNAGPHHSRTIIKSSFNRSPDKNHTRAIYCFVCTLGFVLILAETTHEIKNGP